MQTGWAPVQVLTPRKRMGGLGLQCHSFLTPSLHGSEWLTSRPGRFTPEKEPRCPMNRRSRPKIETKIPRSSTCNFVTKTNFLSRKAHYFHVIACLILPDTGNIQLPAIFVITVCWNLATRLREENKMSLWYMRLSQQSISTHRHSLTLRRVKQ